VSSSFQIDSGKDKMMTEKILRLRPMLSRTGLSRSMAYDLMAKDQFPRPIGLGARAVGWLESEIDAWIVERVKASRPHQ
jgi:prophage regulatory protein